ncbi:angiomotin-like [Haliotis cracherodii]|uniref:angiomotin-like n=1 Tax=Haliotis cracherodii TaxID=6455 RepID=UPI0039E8ADE4
MPTITTTTAIIGTIDIITTTTVIIDIMDTTTIITTVIIDITDIITIDTIAMEDTITTTTITTITITAAAAAAVAAVAAAVRARAPAVARRSSSTTITPPAGLLPQGHPVLLVALAAEGHLSRHPLHPRTTPSPSLFPSPTAAAVTATPTTSPSSSLQPDNMFSSSDLTWECCGQHTARQLGDPCT